MANRQNPMSEPSPLMVYQIRIKGYLDPKWTDCFEGMTITPEENSDTLLSGFVVDQAALHGLFKKVRDLGLTLLSVNCINIIQKGDNHE